MSEQSFRVGLVGCGRIAKNHFDALAKVDGLTLAAVCDIDAARVAKASDEQGVPGYASIEEMLESAAIEVVAICTPSGLHSAQGAAAAHAGKHVVTEKPMSLSLAQADALVHAA